MIVKLLTEHHLEFLSLKGGCRGSSESTHVKMPHCWKSHVLAHMIEMVTGIEGLLVKDSMKALCCVLYERHLIPCLLLVQSRKTGQGPDMTDTLLTEM